MQIRGKKVGILARAQCQERTFYVEGIISGSSNPSASKVHEDSGRHKPGDYGGKRWGRYCWSAGKT